MRALLAPTLSGRKWVWPWKAATAAAVQQEEVHSGSWGLLVVGRWNSFCVLLPPEGFDSMNNFYTFDPNFSRHSFQDSDPVWVESSVAFTPALTSKPGRVSHAVHYGMRHRVEFIPCANPDQCRPISIHRTQNILGNIWPASDVSILTWLLLLHLVSLHHLISWIRLFLLDSVLLLLTCTCCPGIWNDNIMVPSFNYLMSPHWLVIRVFTRCSV